MDKARSQVRVFILVYGNASDNVLPLGNYVNNKQLRRVARDEQTPLYFLHHPDLQTNFETGPKDGIGLEWAHHEKVVVIDQSLAFIGGIDIAPDRYEIHGKFPLFDNPENHQERIWKGKDYGNHHIQDLTFRDFDTDNLNRSEEVRCPWQDVSVQIWGPSARDAGRHFIERWNHCKRQRKKERSDVDLPLIMPKSFNTAEYMHEINEKETRHDSNESNVIIGDSAVLRSAASWSAGFKETYLERSILEGILLNIQQYLEYNHTVSNIYPILKAYEKLIKESKRFIYIENQFFVSSTHKGPNEAGFNVKNKISKFIAERIIKAHQNNEPFKVSTTYSL